MSLLDDLFKPALPQSAQVNDPVGNFLQGWGSDRVQDFSSGVMRQHSGNNLRSDPYDQLSQSLQSGDIQGGLDAYNKLGTPQTAEEYQKQSQARQQLGQMQTQRNDAVFEKQANRLYGDNGLITNLETRRAAQQLASQKILGQMQSQSQLASQGLANQGAIGAATIGAAANLRNTDMAGMWGFKNTLANNASAEKMADMTSGRNLVSNLEQINAQRESSLLANQTARAGQAMNAYTQNLGTVAGALSSAFNSGLHLNKN